MHQLNLPSAPLTLRDDAHGKPEIFDRLRKQYVRLTPEEWVRQHFIHYLIEHRHYPEGLLANEVGIRLGNVGRRCDTVLYDKALRPQMIVEYKAPTVEITQETFNQILRYNMALQVDYLIVSNGLQHYCCRVETDGAICYLQEVPDYKQLTYKENESTD